MVTDNELIFVSIASYRDVQLIPTIQDLLHNAHAPGLLRFGICWQHDQDEPRLPFEGDPRFQILDVDWRDSRGACWARAEIMKLWRGEQWFLQVDSHCRFIVGWDTKLIRMAGETESLKPILSTYANAFKPRDSPSDGPEFLSGPPHLIALEIFGAQGLPQLKPLVIPDFASRDRPVAARFLAAGFLFAPGSFVTQVPYDPELYFFGEEIAMTLRAFTSGYDLFHPIENLVWHDYIRAYATRHWDDHAASRPATSADAPHTFNERDALSQRKVHQLLYGPASDTDSPPDSFGLGTVRTREDYERYAGVSFTLQKVQDYTRYGFEPPNPPCAPDWPDRIYTWMVRVTVDAAAVSPGAWDEVTFWVVTIYDEEYREIRRHDFQRSQIRGDGTEAQLIFICEIQSGIIPAFWSVQPFSRAKGWGSKFQGTLEETDFSIISD